MSASHSHREFIRIAQGGMKVNGSPKVKTRYQVSIFAYNYAKKSVEDCHTYRERCDKAKSIQEKLGHQLMEMQMSMACFIFSELCLEAYVNTYAGDKIDELVWERLERLRLEDKWIIVPKLVLSKTFKTDEEPYKSLKWLVEERNFIVHYKGRFSEPEIGRLGIAQDKVFKKFELENAERGFQLVKDMIKKLHSFDGSSCPDWLV